MFYVAQSHAVSHWESWVWVLGVPGSLLVVLQGMVLCLAVLINFCGKAVVKTGEL